MSESAVLFGMFSTQIFSQVLLFFNALTTYRHNLITDTDHKLEAALQFDNLKDTFPL